MMTNPASGLNIYWLSYNETSQKSSWSPMEVVPWFRVEDQLGIDKEKFYNEVISSQDPCFEVKQTE